MKLVSGERPAVSGRKHGSILIMHSSSLEHFRTGGEADSAWLQRRAGKGEASHLCSSLSVYPWIAASENIRSCSPSLSPPRLCWALGMCTSQSRFSRCPCSSAGWPSDIEGLKCAFLGESWCNQLRLESCCSEEMQFQSCLFFESWALGLLGSLVFLLGFFFSSSSLNHISQGKRGKPVCSMQPHQGVSLLFACFLGFLQSAFWTLLLLKRDSTLIGRAAEGDGGCKEHFSAAWGKNTQKADSENPLALDMARFGMLREVLCVP